MSPVMRDHSFSTARSRSTSKKTDIMNIRKRKTSLICFCHFRSQASPLPEVQNLQAIFVH